MKPWDPITPDSSVQPIRLDLAGEAAWWGHLMAHLHGLARYYRVMRNDAQVHRTALLLNKCHDAGFRIFGNEVLEVEQKAARGALVALMGVPAVELPQVLPVWWGQAAYLCMVMSRAYGHRIDLDGRALLVGDVLRGVRERVADAFTDRQAADLMVSARIHASRTLESAQAETSRAMPAMPRINLGQGQAMATLGV